MPTTAFEQLTISMYLGFTKKFHQFLRTHVNPWNYNNTTSMIPDCTMAFAIAIRNSLFYFSIWSSQLSFCTKHSLFQNHLWQHTTHPVTDESWCQFCSPPEHHCVWTSCHFWVHVMDDGSNFSRLLFPLHLQKDLFDRLLTKLLQTSCIRIDLSQGLLDGIHELLN